MVHPGQLQFNLLHDGTQPIVFIVSAGQVLAILMLNVKGFEELTSLGLQKIH
jgi:hypothetical protein